MADIETFESFCSRYASEEDCQRALFALKWPDGFRCCLCGHHHAYRISTRKIPLYECRRCRAQTSLIAGTVMERSRTPLRLWFQTIYLHARPGGINAVQLSRTIHVTYKTAWLMCHKLRHAMSLAEDEKPLSGLVRVTDALLHHNRFSISDEWQRYEQPLLAGSSEDENGNLTSIKIRWYDQKPLLDRRTSPATRPFIEQYVEREAAKTAIVSSRCGRNANRTLRDICRDAETWLAWTFGGIGTKHLQAYLDHFCYVYNRRKHSILEPLLRECAIRPAIAYPILTGSALRRSSRPTRKPAAAILAS